MYAALHDAGGELAAAIADMDIFDSALSRAHVQRYARYIEAAPMVTTTPSMFESLGCPWVARLTRVLSHQLRMEQVVMDANPPVDTMQAIGEICVSAGVPLWYEPTSIPKSIRVLQAPAALRATKWLSPNLHELSAMAAESVHTRATTVGVGYEDLHREVAAAVHSLTLPGVGDHHDKETIGSSLAALLHAMIGSNGNTGTSSQSIADAFARCYSPRPLMERMGAPLYAGPMKADRRHIFVSLGAAGQLWVDAVWLPIGRAPKITVTAKHYPAIPVDAVVSVTGAGDSFVAAAVRAPQLPQPHAQHTHEHNIAHTQHTYCCLRTP